MKEEAYLKAKEIMDEVEKLRRLKKFNYPFECYSVSFHSGSGSEVSANGLDIGQSGMFELVNTYTNIIDKLIVENLQKLEKIV